jgi:hypothetical protein
MAQAIFVVGYYRSGTSALSGALQRLGVKMFNEADPNEHNPLGFYEIPELIEFDVDLFNRLGVDWTDVRGLPEGWVERADISRFLTRLDEILRRRFTAEDELWGLKHPHLCRTLPLYERAARQAGHVPHAIHIFREPWTAVASQQRKNGLSRAHALLLWMTYITSAEKAARHLPRSWITYRDLLAKPAEQVRRIEQDLGLELSGRVPQGLREAAGSLTGQLNRSEALAHDDLAKPLRALVSRAWEIVQARDFSAETWDGLAAETADMVGFITEIGSSRGRVIPAFGGSAGGVAAAAGAVAPEGAELRPDERSDEGAKHRLLAVQAMGAPLARLGVVIAAPAGRAHAINDTISALHANWFAPAAIRVVAVDAVELADVPVIPAAGAPGAVTAVLCETVQALAAQMDYVAVINAGDTVTPDAVLRFALAVRGEDVAPDMIYCDEVVPRERSNWVRYKPAWDLTRLRQSAYIGDWVWYKAATLRRLGGLNPALAGAEEYDFQLRVGQAGGAVLRLPEVLFLRHAQSRRDDIAPSDFCARAVEAVTANLKAAGIEAVVQNRQYPGLFHHLRVCSDPGTSIIMLCDGGEVAQTDRWMTALLAHSVVTGPVILVGTDLNTPMLRYLTAVTEQTAALEGKVFAVPPRPDVTTTAAALRAALTMVTSELVAIIDVRAEPEIGHWAEALRGRLADPAVAMVGARALVGLGAGGKQFSVQGPVVIGADTRMGAGHLSDDPGPGGWLAVDQEVSAVAPPGLLARAAALRACEIPELSGDALWVDICAQMRAGGGRIVWTPDVSFMVPGVAIHIDGEQKFRRGSAAARALPGADPYHHPALSLHGDLLLPESRHGLVRAWPADPDSMLLSGAAEGGQCVLDAARALRGCGAVEAGWAEEPRWPGDLLRRAAARWVRINPEKASPVEGMSYAAVFSSAPAPEARPAIAGAAELFATSPALARRVRKFSPPGQKVTVWRPSLSARVWQGFETAAGLNSRARILWIDEGIHPAWFYEVITATQGVAAWIVVQRPGVKYAGAVAQVAPPQDETGWAFRLAELGPQIFVRPADEDVSADHYPALIAAASGCSLLVDERLDLPSSLPAVRLSNRMAAWQKAISAAIADLPATLAAGAKTRAAAMGLPSTETMPPPWAGGADSTTMWRAAE